MSDLAQVIDTDSKSKALLLWYVYNSQTLNFIYIIERSLRKRVLSKCTKNFGLFTCQVQVST
jgi:hypothetical protein